MTERIPQSTTKLVVFKAYLASDHVSEATSKTIAITISKNGGAFGNPAAGATNATEISSGWYKVSLGTGDTDTLGPLAVRGAVATVDDVGILLEVVSATSGGYTNLDAAVSGRMATYTQPTGFLAATFPATVASTTNITAAAGVALTAAYDAAKTAATQTSVDDLPTNSELTTALGTADDAVLAQVALVKAKTDNLPSDPADASDIAGAFSTVNTTLGTIAGYIDTEIGTLQTSVNDLPTNAELATALGTADDAVLAQVALVKFVTDQLTFTKPNELDVNIHSVNDVTVAGVGTTGSPWGP